MTSSISQKLPEYGLTTCAFVAGMAAITLVVTSIIGQFDLSAGVLGNSALASKIALDTLLISSSIALISGIASRILSPEHTTLKRKIQTALLAIIGIGILAYGIVSASGSMSSLVSKIGLSTLVLGLSTTALIVTLARVLSDKKMNNNKKVGTLAIGIIGSIGLCFGISLAINYFSDAGRIVQIVALGSGGAVGMLCVGCAITVVALPKGNKKVYLRQQTPLRG